MGSHPKLLPTASHHRQTLPSPPTARLTLKQAHRQREAVQCRCEDSPRVERVGRPVQPQRRG